MSKWYKQTLRQFNLTLYRGSQSQQLANYSGSGLAWQDYQQLTIATEFDCAHADLQAIWQQLLSQQKTQFCGEVVFLESIVKWNDTMLMRWPYYLEINVSYR